MRRETRKILCENPNREKPQEGGEKSTINHWLQDLQRLYAKVLGWAFLVQRKKGLFLTGGESLVILNLICMHGGGWCERDSCK